MISKDREYSLRIELAQAREEIARLSEIIEQRDVDWATERAARERAEARVRALGDEIVAWRNAQAEPFSKPKEKL